MFLQFISQRDAMHSYCSIQPILDMANALIFPQLHTQSGGWGYTLPAYA